MTEKKNLANRIPESDIADYRRWNLPLIDDKGQVLPSAEREAAARKAAEQKKRGERVEDVNYKGELTSGMSASELEKIVESAEREGFEQGRQAGYEKGMAEGYEAGREQGLMEKRQELAAEQQRFQHLAESLLKPIDEQDAELEQLLLNTVCTLTRSLVHRELLTDSSHILTLVKSAVAALPQGAKNLRLYLNPDDLAVVEAYAEEQQLDWQFFADASLVPGGCRVETRESRVDYSVENCLKQQLEAFVNHQLSGEEDGQEDDAEFGSDTQAGQQP
ncbi:flagellar assembly protein FliH [Marinimicrobium sp. ABcell2]|uniref:flagellar assembly protein FliH n=1 Tax=Marinimicrobium sp. ABcell2 TaxID=3069751 RepID=UPI0027B10ACE|nr:flagellar assembly protein FliH [Marinimicrobium sp. ABcell2]MDQ2078095.1 flagellar assembly protein FliH [Marinimicrobium sp. ABcell2]